MRLPPERQAAERHELEAMLEWLATRDGGPLDKPQRRAGWEWLIENTHEWKALKEAEFAAVAAKWKVPFASITVRRYELRLIASVAELWDEARAMHHCAHVFANACASGRTIIVSVRDRQTHRRVATARLTRTKDGWQCAQVRGFANRDPDPRVMQAVRVLVSKLNETALPAGPTSPPAFDAVLGEPPAALRYAVMPRTARDIGWFEWGRSPANPRANCYRVSMNRTRTLWLLWAYGVTSDRTFSDWKVCAFKERRGTKTAAEAAASLLAAVWRRQRDSDSELNYAPTVHAGDLLTEQALLAIVGEVWPDGSPQ